MTDTTQQYTSGTLDNLNTCWVTFSFNMEGAQSTLTPALRYLKSVTYAAASTYVSQPAAYMHIWEKQGSSYSHVGVSVSAVTPQSGVDTTWTFKRLQIDTSKDFLFTFSQSKTASLSGLSLTRTRVYKLLSDTTHKMSASTSYPGTGTQFAYMPVSTFVFTDEPDRGSISVTKGYYKNQSGDEIYLFDQTKSYYETTQGQTLGAYNNIFAVSNNGNASIVVSANNSPAGTFDAYAKLKTSVCMPPNHDYFLGAPEDMIGVDFRKTVNEYVIKQSYSDADNRLQITDKCWLSGFARGNKFGCGIKTGSGAWDTIIKYKTGTIVSGVREQIMSMLNSSYRGINLFNEGSNLYLYLTAQGSSTWIVNGAQSSISLKSNTWYFFRLTYFSNGDFAWRNAETTEEARIDDDITWTWDVYQSAGTAPLYGIEAFLGMYIYYSGSGYVVPTNYYPAKGQFDLLNSRVYDESLVYSALVLNQYAGWTALGGDVYVNEEDGIVESNNLYNSFLTTPGNPAYICSNGNNGLCLVNGTDSTVQTPYRYLGNKKAYNVIGNNKYVFNNASSPLCKIYRETTSGLTSGHYLAYESELGLYMSNEWPLNPTAGNVPIPYPTKVSSYTYDSTTDTYTVSGTEYEYIGDYYADCGPQMFSNVQYTSATMPTISKDLIMSGFSNDVYFDIGTPDWLSSGWIAQFKIKIKSAGRWQKLTGTTSDFKGPAFGLTAGNKFQFESSTNGSSWGVSIVGASSPVEDTWYWVRFGWNGSTYFIDVSTDGTNFTRDVSLNSTTASIASQNMLIGRTWDTSNGGSYWRGVVDLKESWIKKGNDPSADNPESYVWRGAIPFDVLKAPEIE